MLVYDDTRAVIASRAYELAQTGRFEDFEAIARELFAEGFGDDVAIVRKPALQSALAAICIANSESLARD